MTMSSDSLELRGGSPAVAVSGATIPELSFAPVRCPAACARLDRALAAPGHTVLLCGPAGSGKTVTLVDWVTRAPRARAVPVAWLSVLDHPDDLLAALAGLLDRTLVPDGGLRTPIERAADLVAILAANAPTVLVIDDAHLLTDPLELAGLEYLLAHLPAHVTALVAGRFDPPLRWHTLDLAGRLTRIGGAELALSPQRVAQLLAQHGCRLDDAELAVVHTLTRGWAALVRIAAIYLSANAEDRDTALTALARPSHAVADFLVAELLGSLPPATLEFLLATAIPTQFCLPLAEDLVGEDAARILDDLLRANFPLHTVAHGGELWHTYHPLLRAYLLAEGAHTRPERASALHRRVAEWFAAAAMPAPALEHVLAEPGAPGLVDFLREWGLRMVLDGTGQLVLAAVDHLPELAEDTYLRLLRAAVAVEAGDIATAEVYLEAAHIGAGPASRIVPPGWIDALDLAVSAGVAVLVGDSSSARWPLPGATGQPDLDCYAGLHCGTAQISARELDSGTAALRHAIVHAENAGLGRVVVRARTGLALAAGTAGRVGESRALAAQAVESAARYDLSGEAGIARVVAAYGAYQQGLDLPRPLPSLPAAERETCLPAPLRQAAIVTALLSFPDASDRAATATALSRQVHRLLDESPALLGTGRTLLDVVWLLLRVQARTEAQQLIDHALRVLGPTPETTLAEAGLAVYTHRPAAALPLVEPLLGRVAPDLSGGGVVTGWLLVAVAADRLDRPRKADEAFEQALTHACAEDLVRPFLDVPGALEVLDRLGGRFGRFDAFVARVRAQRGVIEGAPQLTETELVVLRQLPSGMTAVSIAGDLGVSVNTVKTHLRGIYQKLGVNARAEAIATARGLGLL
ncbi:LuxR C-terminal-related transcriptional regulator [Nocardia sp. AG03]|uniref:LuxR C-terminal-related transcriptional regulator n=1 Tax=Nocardia sp. AG03 TaxID=3025312 RepID=UPI0024188CEB|nr:LuxR C-terminal-related transcriptional regulator [Nocardia sp. AG03]